MCLFVYKSFNDDLPSDYSNFCLNIYSRLILLFMGVFLPPPSFRLSCGFVSPSPLDVSLIEQLYRICGMAGTMLWELVMPDLTPDSCSLLGLLSGLLVVSLSERDWESGSSESVKSFKLVPLLLSDCLEAVPELPCFSKVVLIFNLLLLLLLGIWIIIWSSLFWVVVG